MLKKKINEEVYTIFLTLIGRRRGGGGVLLVIYCSGCAQPYLAQGQAVGVIFFFLSIIDFFNDFCSENSFLKKILIGGD